MKTVKCACGCGETVPWWKAEEGAKYVNDKHRIAKERRDALAANQKRIPASIDQIKAYCYAFNKDSVDCVVCWENQVCKFRGCYEEPKPDIRKNTDEVRKVRTEDVNHGIDAKKTSC